MKKVLIGIMFLFILTGCTSNSDKTEIIINDLNENSNFQYELLTVVTDDIKSEFRILDGFGVYTLIDSSYDPSSLDITEFMNDNPTSYYDVTAYPDYSDGGTFITRIVTNDPLIHVYDLHVGDTYSENDLIAYMDTIGYSAHEEIPSAYVNERVQIRVYISEGIISRLIIQVEVTNEKGLIF